MFLLPRFKTLFLSRDFLARLPERRTAAINWRKVLLGTVVLMCASLLAFGIVEGVMYFVSREGGSPYKLNQALQQFKSLRDKGESADLSDDLPVPGVYTYKTTGSESASAPDLPSSAYSYPATTTMTVFSSGCGQDWRWQPLTDRYEDLQVCRSSDGVLRLQSRYDLDEFYGVTDSRLFSCGDGSIWLPLATRPGIAFSGKCTNGGNKNSGAMSIGYTGEVAGSGSVVVGGVKVSAVHMVVHETVSGDTVGSGTWSLWLDANDGLILSETRTETTKSDSVVGWVPSTETFTTSLASLSPKQ